MTTGHHYQVTAQMPERAQALVELHQVGGDVGGAGRRGGAGPGPVGRPFREVVPSQRTEQVEALVDCDVLRVATSDLEALASVDPIIARNLATSNALRLRAAEERLAALAFQPVPARLAGVIVELADHFGKVTPDGVRIDVRLTHGTLAEMTGTTRETLTKVAGWLRNEDIVTIERRTIWVHNWDALINVHEGAHCMPGRTAKLVMDV